MLNIISVPRPGRGVELTGVSTSSAYQIIVTINNARNIHSTIPHPRLQSDEDHGEFSNFHSSKDPALLLTQVQAGAISDMASKSQTLNSKLTAIFGLNPRVFSPPVRLCVRGSSFPSTAETPQES